MTSNEQEARIMEDFARHYRIRFRDPDLLRLALTHRSYLSVTGKGPRESNERLEFLGDSVLGLVTSEFLYRAHPTEHEGQLTKTKSLLVSKAILSRRALAMGLGRFVFMSHSEVESGGRQRLSILADGFESVVGAIYLDQGFEPARKFIHDWLLSEAREIAADKRHTNYKSHLQEYVQSTFRTHPVYRIRSEMGPDHSKQFIVDVMVGRRAMGSGRGRNKKEAEQAAARDALEKANHKIVESAPDHETESVPTGSRAATVDRDRELEGDEASVRQRRGRRGGRSRRSDESASHAPAIERERVADTLPPVERARGETRHAETARAAPPQRRSPMVRERVHEPAPPVWEPTHGAFEEEDMEEVGRPEGPLEERRVDPFAVDEEAERSVPPDMERGGSAGGGRSVVGLRYRGAPARVEPESHEEPAAESVETHDHAPARTEESPPSAPGGSRPVYGRRPGRSRR